MTVLYIDEFGDFLRQLAVELKKGNRGMNEEGVQTQGPEYVDVQVTLLKRGGAGAITRRTVVDAVTDETITTSEADVTDTTQRDEKVNSGGTNSETNFYYEADE